MRRDIELLDQREGLVIHRLVVAHHIIGERTHLRVLRFLQRQLGGLDVDRSGRIGNMCNLRVGRFRRLSGGNPAHKQCHRDACPKPETLHLSLLTGGGLLDEAPDGLIFVSSAPKFYNPEH